MEVEVKLEVEVEGEVSERRRLLTFQLSARSTGATKTQNQNPPDKRSIVQALLFSAAPRSSKQFWHGTKHGTACGRLNCFDNVGSCTRERAAGDAVSSSD